MSILKPSQYFYVLENYMKHKVLLFLVVVFLSASLFGCASFLQRTAKTGTIENGAEIGIVFEGKEDKTFRGFMTSALISRGFRVKELNPYTLVGSELAPLIKPYQEFSFLSELTKSIGNSSSGQLEGSEEMMKKLFTANDITDSKERVSDLSELSNILGAAMNVDYILIINSAGGVMDLQAKIVEVKSREVVFTYILKANSEGLASNIETYRGPGVIDKRNQTEPDLKTRMSMNIAEHIASYITGEAE